jgi:hypothetical protein
MKKILFLLLALLLLASCATRAPETGVQISSEPVVETEKVQKTEPWRWPAPTVRGLTEEEYQERWDAWMASQNAQTETTEESVIEEVAEVIAEEKPSEELEAVLLVEELEEVEESPAGTDAISEIEPTEVNEPEEPSAEIPAETIVEILADETEEVAIPEEEDKIELPALQFEFAGEDYRNLSWVLEPEEVIETEAIPPLETVIVEKTVPEETVRAEEIAALAAEYKELEKIDMAKPSFKARLLTFAKEHILLIELGVLAVVAMVIAVIFIKRGRKVRAQAQEAPVIDEGEEIVMTPSYYTSPNAAAERSDTMSERSEAGSEDSREDGSGSEVKAEYKADYEPNYEAEYKEEVSDYEPEDESGYDSEDESEYEEDPGGYNDGF